MRALLLMPTVATQDDSTPSLGLAPPSASRGGAAMHGRIAARLFGEDATLNAEAVRIAHYELIARVGAGGMGVVYEARDTTLGRRVALKLVRRRSLSDRARVLLHNEATLLARLSHPNVVTVYEVGDHGDEVYVAMEYIEGPTLWRWQQRHRGVRELLDAYLQAGAGLHAAHRAGIVHHDFKPNNVLIGNDGRVRVVDFGLAQPLPLDATKATEATSQRLAGTRGYLAPEVLAGAPADTGTDQFALCVSLWEALAGVRPFVSDLHPGEGPLQGKPRGPRRLRRVLARGLASDPAARWPSIEQLCQQLAAIRARHRRIKLAGSAFALTAATALVARVSVTPSSPCASDEALWTGPWDPIFQAQTQRQLRSRDAAVAATLPRLDEALDDYRMRWLNTRDAVCQPGADPRAARVGQRCLDAAEAEVEGLVRALGSGSPGAIEHIDEALASLRSPDTCLEDVSTPTSPRSRLAELYAAESLAAIELGLTGGDLAQAELAARSLAKRLELAFPDTELEARAKLAWAEALRRQGEIEGAQELMTSVVHWAEAQGATRTLARARLALARLHGLSRNQLELGSSWLELAEVSLESLNQPDDLYLEYVLCKADLLRRQATSESLREAEDLLLEALGRPASDHPQQLQLRLATVLADAGRLDDALTLYAQLERDQLDALGPDHPALALVYFDIGVTLLDASDPGQAIESLQRSLALRERHYGASSLRLGPDLAALGECYFQLGDYLQALRYGDRAWALERQLQPRHPDRGKGLRVAANALAFQGTYSDALARFVQLRDDTTQVVDRDDLETLSTTIGWLLCRLDRCREAYAHVIDVYANKRSPNHDYVLAILANIAVDEGRPADARRLIEPALAALEAHEDADPELLAELRWLLARAREQAGLPRDETRRLAHAALATYEQLPPRSDIVSNLRELITQLGSR